MAASHCPWRPATAHGGQPLPMGWVYWPNCTSIGCSRRGGYRWTHGHTDGKNHRPLLWIRPFLMILLDLIRLQPNYEWQPDIRSTGLGHHNLWWVKCGLITLWRRWHNYRSCFEATCRIPIDARQFTLLLMWVDSLCIHPCTKISKQIIGGNNNSGILGCATCT